MTEIDAHHTKVHTQQDVLKTRTRGRSNKFTTPCLAGTPKIYRNRVNSSNSPTVPARGTTLSTQQNDNDNDTTSRNNDNGQVTAITAS